MNTQETLVDTRFKKLAVVFQDQIDELKVQVNRLESNNNSKDEDHNMRGIHKRQIVSKTSSPTKTFMTCEPGSTLCTYFYADHPDTVSKGKYNPPVTNTMMPNRSKVVGIPTSCKHLQLLGHTLNGLYLIKTIQPESGGTKIETVFCDFQLPADVKGKFSFTKLT